MNNNKFDDIAPLYDHEIKPVIQELLTDPGFEHAVKYIMPNISWEEFSEAMSQYETKHHFQSTVIYNTVWMLAKKTTASLTGDKWENISQDHQHLFLSNHRDIVLDAGFLNILRREKGFDTTEIAIGDNLLIHPWIEKLVRINKSFIVRRNLAVREQLTASKHLAEYIHYAITEKGESVWVAQREGRAKNSDDRTQISLLKMLALSPEKSSFIDSLKELNIIPVSISYEYDPCDYLKAKEFQLKRDNPEFKKSQRDDLLNMEMGILGFKGRVLFRFGECINSELEQITEPDKRIQAEIVANIIDKGIHRNYQFFPGNYIAYDLLYNETRFADKYTQEDIVHFKTYLNGQIEKIDIETKDIPFLWSKLLEMYSNTLKNHLASLE